MKLKKGSTRVNEQEKDLLWRSETSFQRIFDYSNDAIFVIDPENDEILNANSMACKMLGYSHEELLARPISVIHPDEMPQLRSFVDSVFEKGSGWTDELTCLTKHGNTLAAEISASSIASYMPIWPKPLRISSCTMSQGPFNLSVTKRGIPLLMSSL